MSYAKGFLTFLSMRRTFQYPELATIAENTVAIRRGRYICLFNWNKYEPIAFTAIDFLVFNYCLNRYFTLRKEMMEVTLLIALRLLISWESARSCLSSTGCLFLCTNSWGVFSTGHMYSYRTQMVQVAVRMIMRCLFHFSWNVTINTKKVSLLLFVIFSRAMFASYIIEWVHYTRLWRFCAYKYL